jgi:hypothetical protein
MGEQFNQDGQVSMSVELKQLRPQMLENVGAASRRSDGEVYFGKAQGPAPSC